MSGKYDDIIGLPHHRSLTHPHMSNADRAAQFSPFAALTGHGAAIKETSRLTGDRIELSDDAKAQLDEQLRLIQTHISESPIVSITCFVPDSTKSGGSYETVTGTVKKIDTYKNVVILHNQIKISINDIFCIEGKSLDY